jgi:hypothetical protein
LELLFFDNLPKQRVYWSWEMGLTTLGALALQTGLYALAGDYPLLAVVSFAAATAIWTALSIARGATEATTGGRAPYLGPGILLTLLLTVTLTAALLDAEIAQQGPGGGAGAAQTAGGTSMTRQVLSRLAHVPPRPVPLSSVGVGTPRRVVSRVVDAGPAIGEKGQNGVPGVVLHPRLGRSQRPTLIAPGPRPRLSPTESLAIPFSGEYHLFRTSSESLPTGAIVEAGTPLESLYGTTNGSPMETVAVQMFEPPIDLSHVGKVWVAVESAESTPVLVSMQLVARGSVTNCGVDLIGIKPGREQLLEFEVPVTARPLLVRAIRISFQHPGPDRDQSVRIAVERITLAPRRDAELRGRLQD